MHDPWALYDRLIAGIPAQLTVEDYGVGCAWTYVQVRETGAMGVALTVRQRAGRPEDSCPIVGQSLRAAAELVKSWHFIEASIGAAALNAWYNSPGRLRGLGLLTTDMAGEKAESFSAFGRELAGKKVAVIGHFPQLEKKLAPICQLSILEREPQNGDYPDSACEYILPQQDYSFITGMTLTNKTLPRLLELCRPGKVCLVGPSAPLTDILFDFGVDCISGFCGTEQAQLREALRRGVKQGVFRGGTMLNYIR